MLLEHLLLEYDKKITQERFGEALYDRYSAEMSPAGIRARKTIQNNIMDMVNKGRYTADEAKQLIKNRILHDVFYAFDTHIPDKYIPWAMNLYIKGGIQRLEDVPQAGVLIDEHMQLRKNGFFQRNPELNKEFGDLGRFKKLSELAAFIRSTHTMDTESNASKDREEGERLIKEGQAQIVYDDAEWKVIIPKTEKAAIYFGRNTQWCTAAKNDNMFDEYNDDGPLYVILKKKENRRWQLHIETNQLMDENDEETSVEDLMPLFNKNIIDFKSAYDDYGLAMDEYDSSIFKQIIYNKNVSEKFISNHKDLLGKSMIIRILLFNKTDAVLKALGKSIKQYTTNFTIETDDGVEIKTMQPCNFIIDTLVNNSAKNIDLGDIIHNRFNREFSTNDVDADYEAVKIFKMDKITVYCGIFQHEWNYTILMKPNGKFNLRDNDDLNHVLWNLVHGDEPPSAEDEKYIKLLNIVRTHCIGEEYSD